METPGYRSLEEVNKVYQDMSLKSSERFSAIAWIEDRYDCFHCPHCDTFVRELGSDGVDCVDCEAAFKIQLQELVRGV